MSRPTRNGTRPGPASTPVRGRTLAEPDAAHLSAPCCVYLLLHEGETRFKIGVSFDPRQRGQQLPEARSIAFQHSALVQLPSRQRAYEVERMLHKGLAGFRLAAVRDRYRSSNGDTEWFAMAGLPCAVELLRVTPLSDNLAEPVRLLTLDHQPYQGLHASDAVGLTQAQQRKQQSAEFNVRRMALIGQLLSTLNQRLEIHWLPAVSPSRCAVGQTSAAMPERLRIPGLRNAWDPEMLKARFEVVSSALWQLQTGHADPMRATRSLVSLIQYRPDDPDTLELWVSEADPIRRLPGGVKLLEMWRAICLAVS